MGDINWAEAIRYNWTILNGDCRELFRGVPDGSIDAIITDPPYGIDFQSGWRTATDAIRKIANDKAPYIWWIIDAARVLKDGGAMLCFSRWDVDPVFLQAFELAGLKVKSQVVWDKVSHGMGDLKASFAPTHETVWFVVKGGFEFPGKRPRSVVSVPKVSSDKIQHPNEKPVALMRELVEAITRPGDLILDPFAGSGSTVLGAVEAGRRAVGFELDPRYVAMIETRLEGAAVA